MSAQSSEDFCRKNSGVDMADTAFVVDHDFLHRMQEVGVSTIARYYDYENETLPKKRLRPPEIQLLRDHGLKLLVVFQHHNNKASTFANWKKRGPLDAAECLKLAERFQQPEESTIYFGVDADIYGDIPGYPGTHYTDAVHGYFEEIANVFARENAAFGVGVYGGGACINGLSKRGLVRHRWLSHSHGFVGSKVAYKNGEYDIAQYLPGECGGRSVDFNAFQGDAETIGAFNP